MVENMVDQKQKYNSLENKVGLTKSQYPNIAVLANKMTPPL